MKFESRFDLGDKVTHISDNSTVYEVIQIRFHRSGNTTYVVLDDQEEKFIYYEFELQAYGD